MRIYSKLKLKVLFNFKHNFPCPKRNALVSWTGISIYVTYLIPTNVGNMFLNS